MNKTLILPLVEDDPRTSRKFEIILRPGTSFNLRLIASKNRSGTELITVWQDDQSVFHMFWEALVEKYNTRKLTKAQDVLPAVSALASFFQPV